MSIEVLIEAAAGSSTRTKYDEKLLRPLGERSIGQPYPYSYGFVLDTTGADGDNVDCYVVGDTTPQSGTIVACEVVALLDQIESNGEADHKVLAVVLGEDAVLAPGVVDQLTEFIYAMFAEYPNAHVRVGPVHSAAAALAYLADASDR